MKKDSSNDRSTDIKEKKREKEGVREKKRRKVGRGEREGEGGERESEIL